MVIGGEPLAQAAWLTQVEPHDPEQRTRWGILGDFALDVLRGFAPHTLPDFDLATKIALQQDPHRVCILALWLTDLRLAESAAKTMRQFYVWEQGQQAKFLAPPTSQPSP